MATSLALYLSYLTHKLPPVVAPGSHDYKSSVILHILRQHKFYKGNLTILYIGVDLFIKLSFIVYILLIYISPKHLQTGMFSLPIIITLINSITTIS